MKKSVKILMAAALTLVSIGASAQFGVKFGYANLPQRMKASGVVVKPGNLNGFNAGVFYDIRFPLSGLSLRPGLSYTYGGGKFGGEVIAFDEEISIKQREHIVNLPIDVKYAYGFTNDFKVYAFAGPRLAVGLSSTFKAREDGETAKVNNFTGKIVENGETEDGGSGIFSRFDVRLGIGTGVQCRSLLFEVGYDWGMLDRFTGDAASGATYKMGQLFVGVGFMF